MSELVIPTIAELRLADVQMGYDPSTHTYRIVQMFERDGKEYCLETRIFNVESFRRIIHLIAGAGA